MPKWQKLPVESITKGYEESTHTHGKKTVHSTYTVHTWYTRTQAPHAVHTRYTHYRTCSSPHFTACVLSSRTTLIVFPQAINSVPSSETCTVPILISEGCERGERGNLRCAHLNQWERGERKVFKKEAWTSSRFDKKQTNFDQISKRIL